MKRLLIALVVLTGLIGAGGAVWAQDLNKGLSPHFPGERYDLSPFKMFSL